MSNTSKVLDRFQSVLSNLIDQQISSDHVPQSHLQNLVENYRDLRSIQDFTPTAREDYIHEANDWLVSLIDVEPTDLKARMTLLALGASAEDTQ